MDYPKVTRHQPLTFDQAKGLLEEFRYDNRRTPTHETKVPYGIPGHKELKRLESKLLTGKVDCDLAVEHLATLVHRLIDYTRPLGESGDSQESWDEFERQLNPRGTIHAGRGKYHPSITPDPVHRGYLIKKTSDGMYSIQKGGYHIGYAKSVEQAIAEIDNLLGPAGRGDTMGTGNVVTKVCKQCKQPYSGHPMTTRCLNCRTRIKKGGKGTAYRAQVTGHGNHPHYICPVCSESFSSQKIRDDHKALQHSVRGARRKPKTCTVKARTVKATVKRGACPACGSEDVSMAGGLGNLMWYRCRCCGLDYHT